MIQIKERVMFSCRFSRGKQTHGWGSIWHRVIFLTLCLALCHQTALSQHHDRNWPYNYLPQLIIFGVGVQPTSWQELQRKYPSLDIREGDRFIFTSTKLDILNAALGHSIYEDLERLDIRRFRRTIAHSKATYSLALYLEQPDYHLNINFGKKIALAPYGEAEKYFNKAVIDNIDVVPFARGKFSFRFGGGEQKIYRTLLRDPETGRFDPNPLAHHKLEAYMQYYNKHVADERDAPDYRPPAGPLDKFQEPKTEAPQSKREEDHLYAGDPPSGGPPGGPSTGAASSHEIGLYRDLGEPRVGGVYLNGIAKVVSDFGEISGAMFDKELQRLIVVGNATVKLPKFPLADLTVAFENVFSGHDERPGVSIDPAQDDPRGPTMGVRYLGGVEDTHFGWVLFEADRVMKGLSLGEDNITHEPVHCDIDGFFTMPQLTFSNLSRPESRELWNRFWLVPDNLVAFIDTATNSMRYKGSGIRVKTETMKLEGNRLASAGDLKDPRAEYFANHLSVHYDDYAARYPIFAELARLARAVGIARWLQESGIRLSTGFADLPIPRDFETPRTTPSHEITITEPEVRGDTLYTSRLTIFGGVDFSSKPFWAKDDGSANRFGLELNKALTQAETSPGENWPLGSVEIEGQKHYTFSLPVGPTGGSLTLPIADILTIRDSPLAFPVIRYFNSFHNEPSEFGHGWSLGLPILKSRNPDPSGGTRMVWVEGKEDEKIAALEYWLTDIFGHEGPRFPQPLVHPVEGAIIYVWQKFGDTTLLYPRPDGSASIHFPMGQEWEFDALGRLIWMRDDDVRFVYGSTNLLEKISMLHRGQELQFDLLYDSDQRVREIQLDGKKQVSYYYGTNGGLSETAGPETQMQYEYDSNRLITKISQNGKLLFAANFDDFGRWQR
jgi:hypothetical protein